MTRDKAKVFGIGFQKTGTTSLHHFLRRLGYRAVHWPHVVAGTNYEKLCIPVLHSRNEVLDVLAPLVGEFDAFTDVPWPALYRELCVRVPESRFIHVQRDSESWWESVARHWRLTRTRPRRLDPYEYLAYNLYGDGSLTHVTLEDAGRMKEIFLEHDEAVRSFFADKRERLAVVRLDDPAIGEAICEFLGIESDRPFPALTRRSPPAGAPSMGKWR